MDTEGKISADTEDKMNKERKRETILDDTDRQQEEKTWTLAKAALSKEHCKFCP